MATAKPKVEYTKPTSQLDLEARQAAAEKGEAPVFNPSVNPNPVGDEGFVGVSPEYQNFANDTDKPLASEEGAEAVAEEAFEDSFAEEGKEETSPAVAEKYEEVTHGAQTMGVGNADASSPASDSK